jgi:uncharacterized BrkB/YihY/UPF0761 family membrane protein
VYYSCQILLLGAEFTRVYAEHRGATFDPQVFATQRQGTQSGDTGNQLDLTQPTSANA